MTDLLEKGIIMEKTKTSDLVSIHGQKIRTDSLIVAERFKKRHGYVIDKIEKLIDSDKDNQLIFRSVTYVDSKGEDRKMYTMDRKSFSILCMGFSGEKALRWKIQFYTAFEAMEKILLQQQNEFWKDTRLGSKESRGELTHAIQKAVKLAESQGSKNANRYYTLFTKLIYNKLFGLQSVPDGFRDSLNDAALRRLKIVETQVGLWIEDAVDSVDDYHDVFRNVKKQLNPLIQIVGSMPAIMIPA